MKWLFAALVSVCLFACGGPQDEAGLEKQARGGDVLCDGSINADGTSCGTKDPLLGKWCYPAATSTKWVVSINASGTGVSVGTGDPCWTYGDSMWDTVAPTPGSPGSYTDMRYNTGNPNNGGQCWVRSSSSGFISLGGDKIVEGIGASVMTWYRCAIQ